MSKLAISCGDPNGIGPEIILKSAAKLSRKGHRFVVFGPREAFLGMKKLLTEKMAIEVVNSAEEAVDSNSKFTLVDLGYCKVSYGKPTKSSGMRSFESIKAAFEFVSAGHADALITAPISKEALHNSGVDYPGHTEMLADWSKSKKYLMMFHSEEFIAALATIHLPLSEVAANISKNSLSNKLELAYRSLKTDFAIDDPKIAVLGLNPHAGESGHIGKEERSKIVPAIKHQRNLGIRGAFVPDAFFGNHQHKNFDLVFGMYHDQVLIPFKMLNFNTGVNFTAGLPIVRTSPDHGTAFDIAGRGIADPSSMIQAIKLAHQIAQNRKNAQG